jgi:CRISPR-associated protein Cas2
VYVIIVYDVAVCRVTKVCQFLRQYLNWIQNSVFEGELTESELKKIEVRLKEITNENEDSVIIYILRAEKALRKKFLGTKKAEQSSII